MIEYRPIKKDDLPGVMNLCRAEPWPSYVKDSDRTWQVLTAPGVTTVVAVDSGQIVGFTQMQSDGAIQAHLSLILVAAACRRQRIGTQLVKEVFKLSGAERIDLVTEDAQAFYRSFAHREWTGFRIHPQVNKDAVPNQAAESTPSDANRLRVENGMFMSDVEYASGSIELLDTVAPLWVKNAQHNAAISTHFPHSENVVSFEARRSGFEGQARSGKLQVHLAKLPD